MLDITQKIALVGTSQSAAALISGLIKQGMLRENILVCSEDEEGRRFFSEKFFVRVSKDIGSAIAFADVVVLAVPPSITAEYTIMLNDEMEAQQMHPLIITIMAGITASEVSEALTSSERVVAAIPNMPSAICKGVIGLYASEKVGIDDVSTTERIMSALGETLWVESENEMPALAAANAGLPAYFLMFMEALEKAAIDQGLDPATAKTSVLQSAIGAVNMVKRSSESLSTLRGKLTSATNGTESGVAKLEQGQIDELVAIALSSAASRMEELYSKHSTNIH
ncbi:NAD(P)-binding domain-containing protein [Aestuariibacter sp. AA17]|uniref:Pyrroline-5-carboxylate reductase n=1 Tax=Fluctibacter corallii TaxID=2984329 RepID=A0ABT3A8Z0_9ALTE|nr:pyrroline-5-carboxylate reductase dimerization domain-containing protein [Aestuariibacter sp. AA17]MCV2885150.1 NAD(P)-binding domain-containing protein [Aestuariibacter sp. AA17]